MFSGSTAYREKKYYYIRITRKNTNKINKRKKTQANKQKMKNRNSSIHLQILKYPGSVTRRRAGAFPEARSCVTSCEWNLGVMGNYDLFFIISSFNQVIISSVLFSQFLSSKLSCSELVTCIITWDRVSPHSRYIPRDLSKRQLFLNNLNTRFCSRSIRNYR